MADLETLKRALKNADAAGDTAAAKKFADAIRAQQGGGASAPAAPVEDRATLAQIFSSLVSPASEARRVFTNLSTRSVSSGREGRPNTIR